MSPGSKIARPTAGRRRLLVCTPFTPRLDARHGGKATSQLLLHIAERHEVALLALRAPGEQPVDPAIAELCARVEEVPLADGSGLGRRAAWAVGLVRGLPPWATDCRSGLFADRLERLLDEWRPEIVEIHLQALAQYVAAPVARGVPRVLVDYDPGSAWADEVMRRTTGPRRLIRKLEVLAWRRYERATRPLFDAIVVFADRDVAAFEPSARETAPVRIPLAIDLLDSPLDPTGAEPPTILFVGGFAHPPNVDAAVWLARSIFPRVAARVPEARLELVGQEPRADVCALAGGSVSVHASVPDVTPYLDRAAVVVAPIRIGGSMRMKVLEALGAGKALVATPRAAEGVAAIPGEHFVLAAGEDELVDALTGLLEDPARRRQLGENARGWAERELGWSRSLAAFERLYDDLAGSVQ